MAILTRLARLARADLNAVLDRLEAPELVLGQAVREMEQALDQERLALSGFDRELERLARREAALAEDEARCAERIDAGLEQAPEDAAEGEDRILPLLRALIRQRLGIALQRATLRGRMAEVAAERDRRARRAEDHARCLDDLRARAALALAPLEGAMSDARWPGDDCDLDWPRPDAPTRSAPVSTIAESEVELELLRLRRQGVARGGAA